MTDRKTKIILSLIFCPMSGIPTYVAMSALLRTPVTWIYWLIMALSLCAACTVSVFYQDIIHGIALLVTRKSRLAQIRMDEEIKQELDTYATRRIGAIRSGITTQDANRALTLMANSTWPVVIAENQQIEPYTPPEPEPRYELVMQDESVMSSHDEVDHGKIGIENKGA